MTTNEAFEAWYDDEEITPLPDDYTILGKRYLYMGWCAATTEANKRIAELDSEIAELKVDINEYIKISGIQASEITELQASNNHLRESGQALIDRWDCPKWKDVEHTGFFIDALRKALSATPAESLQAHDDELIKKCAKVCDKWIGLEAVADAILALKEVK